MGNAFGIPLAKGLHESDAAAIFHTLDMHRNGYLTLKDLMDVATPGLMMPHSLPALFFFDEEKDGTLTAPEFVALVHFCQSEKRKVEAALIHDKHFRDLIHRASRAGVTDCSMPCRSSFRRFSSYSNVRSVFSSRPVSSQPASSFPPSYPVPPSTPYISSSFSSSSDDQPAPIHPQPQPLTREHNSVSSDASSMDQDELQTCQKLKSVAMYSSQAEFCRKQDDLDDPPDPELRDPQNRTALDAAVLENIVHANIHKLADLLHTEGSREQFMAWLWNLADFNSSGVVTLEELHVFLTALSEDGIDLEELAFYREGGVPLEECIINEFDTTHTGLLTRDEFMVLADLVTREYEFWENRHLERIGDYELGRTIGRGSSGVVRLASHVVSRHKVAIKIIKKGKCSDLSRLDREIQSLMAAKHQNIVALEEVLESENNLFIVMELCGGGSMVDIVRLYPEERMPEETARFFMRQVFEALAFCHRNGICHRDVRLDNIMLDNAGNVKITDFGHSGIYTPGWDLFSTSLVGSVYNLSPEQIRGQCYSGEKIDIWSAGVAVYCLLVGHPPFFDADVSPLLEKITSCDFEIPDFISEKTADLIRCMIRAVPEERITIQQMLHHPWFYDGPEYGPSMDVVVIPLDPFYKKRPDIAEVILAVTIYEHNLHSHLADTLNPKCSPEDLRGQEWTLKCLCPKSNIKFSISLFTKEPCLRQKEAKLPVTMSCSVLTEAVLTDAALNKTMPKRCSQRVGNDALCKDSRSKLRREGSLGNAMFTLEAERSKKAPDVRAPFLSLGSFPAEFTPSRPPSCNGKIKDGPLSTEAVEKSYKVTGTCRGRAVFDFEKDNNNEDFSISSMQVEGHPAQSKTSSGNRNKSRLCRHSRSHSLDESGSLMRLDRSATVDAFPYQKVYPQRKMPEGVEQLNFDRPDLATLESLESTDSPAGEIMSARSYGGRASRLSAFHRSVTLHAVSSYSDNCRLSTPKNGYRGDDITLKLSRHPSKAVSPQSPQPVRVAPSPQQEMLMNDVEDLPLIPAALPAVIARQGIGRKIASFKQSGADNTEVPGIGADVTSDFQPFIELRRQDGESGLFLKVCRKFKTICTTKLAATAERQKMRSAKVKSTSTLHRTESSKSIESAVTAASVEASRTHAF